MPAFYRHGAGNSTNLNGSQRRMIRMITDLDRAAEAHELNP
jgi:hypothetical protein